MKSTYSEKAFVVTEIDKETDQTVKEEWFDEEDRPHRARDLPAVTRHTEDETKFEYWYHGRRNRNDGPADVSIWRETGVVYSELWYSYGEFLGAISRDIHTGEVVHSDFESPSDNHPNYPIPG